MTLEDSLRVLGIAPGASKEVARAAYLARVPQYHPDKVAALGVELQDLAGEKTKQINEAYRIVLAAAAATGRVPSPLKASEPPEDLSSAPSASASDPRQSTSMADTAWWGFISFLLEGMRRAPIIPVALVGWCGVELFSADYEPPAPGPPVTTPTTTLEYTPSDSEHAPAPRGSIALPDLDLSDGVLAPSPSASPSSPLDPAMGQVASAWRSDLAWTRPDHAPNGATWPYSSGYIAGYERLNASGLASITIDNTRNESDVLLKVVSLDAGEPLAVRVVFIRARDSLKIRSIDRGRYDIRYRDLDSGAISKSDSFDIVQIEDADGTRYSDLTITLYKVEHGNMHTVRIPESEF